MFNAIEIERENHALSTIILSSNLKINWSSIYNSLLANIVNNGGR